MSSMFELSMIENAHDFIESSAIHAKKDDYTAFKYALLHLHAGLELLLKTRLEKEHWSLLFYKIEEASLSAFKKGDFQSVSIKQSLERLKNIAEIKISKKMEKDLKSISRIRNQIQHHQVSINSNV